MALFDWEEMGCRGEKLWILAGLFGGEYFLVEPHDEGGTMRDMETITKHLTSRRWNPSLAEFDCFCEIFRRFFRHHSGVSW
jgi:hypothetical protein